MPLCNEAFKNASTAKGDQDGNKKRRKNHFATDLEANSMKQKVPLSSFQFNILPKDPVRYIYCT